ncbi:MAG: tetratricopeptide repeat protein, partial [Pyrinomonadaceae bacterium]|nr:tetratricopeptide repeat protein [Pyrinomonadaceae bacterium]
AQLPKDAVLAMLRTQPNDFALNLRAGSLLSQEGDYAQAITHLKRVIEFFPYFTSEGNAYEQLAKLYEARGETVAAADVLELLIKQDENNLEALKNLAQLRLKAGDKARALEALRLAFYISPFDHQLHTSAGNLHLERREADKAVTEYKVALALNPPNQAEAHYNLARAYVASNQPLEAKRQVIRALEAAPSYDKAQDLLLDLTEGKKQ